MQNTMYTGAQTAYCLAIMNVLSRLPLFCLLLCALAAVAQAVEYKDLTAQQQADVSRFLGWVWADGKPLNTNLVTGIRSEVRHAKYVAVVDSLLEVPGLGFELGNTGGEPDPLKVKQPWNFWNNSLPGGNPDDPKLLRDAIRNPNFLAGIIEGEGGYHEGKYVIDDHFHGPCRRDKVYGLANFGPERILQLFELLGETYGFTNTTIQVGGGANAPIFTYAQRDAARADLQQKYDVAKAQNVAVNEGDGGSYRGVIPVRVFIDQARWDTLRSYGFFFAGRIPTSPTDTPHRSLSGTQPADDLPLATGTMGFFDRPLRPFKACLTRQDANALQLSWSLPGADEVVDIQRSADMTNWDTVLSAVPGSEVTVFMDDAARGFFRVRRSR